MKEYDKYLAKKTEEHLQGCICYKDEVSREECCTACENYCEEYLETKDIESLVGEFSELFGDFSGLPVEKLTKFDWKNLLALNTEIGKRIAKVV